MAVTETFTVLQDQRTDVVRLQLLCITGRMLPGGRPRPHRLNADDAGHHHAWSIGNHSQHEERLKRLQCSGTGVGKPA